MKVADPRRGAATVVGIALLLASSCGEQGDARSTATREANARVRSVQALEERIAHLEASGHAGELLLGVRAMLQARPRRNRFELDGWAVAGHELEFIDAMSSPGRAGQGNEIEALDFECLEHPLHVMVEYDRELEEHGIDLLIVPVPNRAQVWSDRLPDVSSDEQCLGGDLATPRLLLAMSEAGLDVVDLYPVFAAARVEARSRGEEAELYQCYNPHWSPLGVRVAAAPIAERIRVMEWFEAGPAREGEHFFRQVERRLDSAPQFAGAPSEKATLTFERILDAEGKNAHRVDRASPILLLSDSYGAVYGQAGSNVVSHLFTQLGYPLDTIAIPRGAVNSVWQAVARRGDGLEGKKLVIWLFSCSVLRSREMHKVAIFPTAESR